MTNHNPTITSSSATGSFSENANTTNSSVAHVLTGTMNFTDSDHSDTHSTTVALKTKVWSGGSAIPAPVLADLNAAMSSVIQSDSNGSGKLKWTFNAADKDFDFLAKNETLVLTYEITLKDNHGGSTKQTVKVTITGTDDKPVIAIAAAASVTEQANHSLSLSPDTVHVALQFVDPDLTNTGHTASVTGVSASGNTSGILPGILGTAELLAFFHVDNVVKTSGSSNGTINTTFSAPDLAFDYLGAGQTITITYTVLLDDHAGGTSTQNVVITVNGTNDKPVFLSGPDTEHLTEGAHLSPGGNLTAHGDFFFGDIDLSDTHSVSVGVTAARSGGGAVPISNADLLAAFSKSIDDSTGHLAGDVDWSFALDNDRVNFLANGETLTLVYTLTLTDSAGGTDTQTVTVTILGTNDAPVMTSGPESASLTEFADTTGSSAANTSSTGTLTFTDGDLTDTHSVTVSFVSADWSGGASIPAGTQSDLASALLTSLSETVGSGTGSIDWTFSIADADLDFLADGETVTVTYSVVVHDASESDAETVTITILGTNDGPLVTSAPQSATLAEQDGLTDSPSLDTTSPVPTGTLGFTDVDVNDTHTVGVAVASAIWSANADFVPGETYADLQTALATTLHDSSGSGSGSVDWTFSIRDGALDFLSAGETLTVTYNVTVYDGAFAGSTQTVTITIDGAADPLTLNPASVEASETAFFDSGLVIATGSIPDLQHPVDLSSPRTVTEVNGVAADVGQPVTGTYGTLYLFADGFYAYVANSAVDPLQVGDNVADQFNFTVDDGQGHTATTTLTFNVAGVDDAPVITAAVASGSVTEDAGPPAIVNGDFETGDLSGWTTSGSHIAVQQLEFGGSFGHYTVSLGTTGVFETLEQDIATIIGQHYFVSFVVVGDPEAGSSPLSVSWGGNTLLSLANVPGGVNQYAFDVIATSSTTTLQFTYADDGNGMLLDQVNVNSATGPATESADGSISFTDIETGDTHTASAAPLFEGYVGTFSLDPLSESSGSGSVAWHFTVDNADIQYLAQGESIVQTYTVSITGDHGAASSQDVSITITGTNDAPTAVADTVITNVDVNNFVDIPAWALAVNDTDPDLTDILAPNAIVSDSGGTAIAFVDAIFFDDSTLGGSFDYTVTDGHATSGNAATVTVVNNPASTSALVGTSGADILIGSNGAESLSGGGGNDILIGNAGSHVLTGGAGDDIFAFMAAPGGTNTITDFDNVTDHDSIAISASAFGAGLTAGMSLAGLFEVSSDAIFQSSFSLFHYDDSSQTLYFSTDGTTESAVTVAQFQPGVSLNAGDFFIV